MASGIVDGLCTMGPTVSGKRFDRNGLDGRRQRGRNEDEVSMGELSESGSLVEGDEGDGFGRGEHTFKEQYGEVAAAEKPGWQSVDLHREDRLGRVDSEIALCVSTAGPNDL
jgi:hypothetical protein